MHYFSVGHTHYNNEGYISGLKFITVQPPESIKGESGAVT